MENISLYLYLWAVYLLRSPKDTMHLQSTIHPCMTLLWQVGPQVPQVHEWEQYYKGLYGDLSDHYLGVKNTSEFLTLCPCLNLWCFLSIFGRFRRHMHQLSYKVPTSETNYHLCSFFPNTIKDWNSLSLNVIEVQSINSFWAQLDMFWLFLFYCYY